MSARLIAAAVLAATAAAAAPASAIVAVVGPRCEYRNGGPAVDTGGTGLITAGPLVPVRQPGVIEVRVNCSVQVGSAEFGVNERLRASQRTFGTAGVLVHPTTSGPSGDLYVCTWLTWQLASGASDGFVDDADPVTPGVQCRKAA